MDKAEGMDHLDGKTGRKRLYACASKGFAGEHGQDGPNPLAACCKRVGKGLRHPGTGIDAGEIIMQKIFK